MVTNNTISHSLIAYYFGVISLWIKINWSNQNHICSPFPLFLWFLLIVSVLKIEDQPIQIVAQIQFTGQFRKSIEASKSSQKLAVESIRIDENQIFEPLHTNFFFKKNFKSSNLCKEKKNKNRKTFELSWNGLNYKSKVHPIHLTVQV